MTPSSEQDNDLDDNVTKSWLKSISRIFWKPSEADLREVIQSFIEEQKTTDDLGLHEQGMLLNILGLNELAVHDIMVPRADVFAIEAEATIEQALHSFRDSEHSRIPVYKNNLDDPVGFLHIKDVLPLILKKEIDIETHDIQNIIREILYIPPSINVLDLLLKMQATHIHMALVIDEYGGTDGLVTIEDLIEQVVGRIDDEHDDKNENIIIRCQENLFEVDGRIQLQELEQQLKVTIYSDEYEDIDTLAGLMIALVGRVPQRGEIISYSDTIEFHVVDSDPRRVKKIRINLKNDPTK